MIETFAFINEEFPWFFQLLSFVFGTVVGSFLNVCIYRIPEGRSVVFPGSTCSCGQRIMWFDNIPILSWLLLRGKARCCGQKFSIRYALIELLTGVLFYISWYIHPPIVAILGFLFIAFLICATFIDLDHMIIPDRFSVGGMVIGVSLSIFFPVLHGLETESLTAHIQSGIISVTGALIGAGLVYWIAVLGEIVFRKPAMGEGDVKFVGFIGAFCGWQGAVFSMFGGAFIGSVILLPVLIVGRLLNLKKNKDCKSEDTDKAEDEIIEFGSQVPFGPMLAAGGLVYFLGFSTYVDAYFESFTFMFMNR
jgi:leader peptidase (prepilin peptidase) / N-methyltransferase